MPPFNFPPLDFKLPKRTEEEKAYCKRFFEVWDEFLEQQRIANGMPPVDMTSNNIYSSRLEARENTANCDNFERTIKIYVYHHEYTDGPQLPTMFTVNHVYDGKFRYHEYPRLIMLLDSRQNNIEVWNHNKGRWKPLDAVGGCKSVDSVFTGQFLILRRADHPTGSNCNLIGFSELVRELDFVFGKEHRPTALSPDNLCPSDATGNLMDKDWLSFGRDYPSPRPYVASDDSLFHDDESDNDDEF